MVLALVDKDAKISAAYRRPFRPARWCSRGGPPFHAHCINRGENLWTLEGGDGSWATSGMGVAVFVGPEPVEDWIIFEGFEPGRRTYPAGQGA